MSRLRWTLLEWFLFIYVLALIARGIWWVSHLPPLGMIFVLLLSSPSAWGVWQFKTYEKRAEAQEKRLGYRVLYLSPNILRMGIEEWAVEYRENGQSFLLYGKVVKKGPNTLDVPSVEHWNESVPEWAKGRREEILRRVRAEEAKYHFVIREI